ncbi:Bug family tripartite tricarboxylate transporter substrate binding protein [Phytoactinopolyspora halophila]|nr:tripartite tricarboxylate transporter substrate binding protein [Phytoactinopolyspora halophila]
MRKRPRIRTRCTLLSLAAPLLLAPAACASDAGSSDDGGDDYPSESIRVIITFDPGGGSDTDFRRLQPHLEESLGVSLEPEYVTGAGGAIGWAELANAEPDGYTIGTVVLPHILLQPELIEDTGYETSDFDIIGMNAYAPQILFVDAEDPAFESFDEFEAHVQENPGNVDIGGAAEYNLSHAVQVMLDDAGLDTNYVATGEGATAVVSGVRGGHYPVGITSIQQYFGAEDEIQPLAVSSEETYELASDIPTLSELGYDVSGSTNWGLAAPEGTDPEKIEIISDAVADALDEEDVLQNMEDEGQGMIGTGPEESEEYVQDYLDDIRSVTPLFEQ